MVVAAAGALVLTGAGLAAGMMIRPPAQPHPDETPRTVLTAPVESRRLTTEHAGAGTFTPAAVIDVAGIPGPDMLAVVTATPLQPGDSVTVCRSVVEISGRPVVALPGGLPAYRDLRFGDTGPDVEQLQRALTECGHAVRADGRFGAATDRALRALYRAAGYRATTQTVTADPAPPADAVTPAGPAAPADAVTPTGTGDAAPAATVEHAVLPRAEVVFLPAAARVTAVAALGAQLDDEAPAVTLAVGATTFAVRLDAAQRAALAEGLPVEVAAAGWSGQATLPALPAQPELDPETGAETYPVRIPLPDDVPPGLDGQTGTYTVVVGPPEPFDLVVPTTALRAAADAPAGNAFVLVADPADPRSSRRVSVTVPASAGGFSAVQPVEGDRLTVGEQVIVGEG